MSATQEQFFRSFRIPQVVGAMDGTLVPTLTPCVDAHVFICRKGYAAVNCQVVCDHQGIILDVVARWPGSTHDSFVFRESSDGRLAATSRGEWRLLGDSGYPLRPYLIKPVANPQGQRCRNKFESGGAKNKNKRAGFGLGSPTQFGKFQRPTSIHACFHVGYYDIR